MAGNPGGGSITFGTAPTNTETVVVVRNVPLTQQTDYQANDPFPAESHEEALDKLTMLTQQIQDAVNRSIKLSATNTMTSTEFTVGAVDRANKILAFDSSGEIAVTQEIGTYRGNWASGTAYQQRDIIKDTSNANIYICLVAHTSTGTQPISTNADGACIGRAFGGAAADSVSLARFPCRPLFTRGVPLGVAGFAAPYGGRQRARKRRGLVRCEWRTPPALGARSRRLTGDYGFGVTGF